jgi:hypothetical protein
LQVPLAVYQRYVIYSQDRFSGDDVQGTLMESGVLSVVLICMVMVLTGLFLRKRIGKMTFILLFFILLVPTTLNETKVTAIVLPIGLLTTLVAASPAGKRMRVFLGGISLLVVFAAILIPVYDFMNANSPYKEGRTLEDFFTNQETMSHYMEQKKGAALGMTRDVRRGDAIQVPLQYLSRDPIQLAFGLGIGNASHSNIGAQFTGAYNPLFDKFLLTDFTVFILEIGIFGTALVFLLYWFVFIDTLAVAKLDTGMTGAIAAGWIGVVAIMVLVTFYSTGHVYASVSYLYWYFSGVIAARRMQLQVAQQRSTTAKRRLPHAAT